MECVNCGLPDMYEGGGDGIGSCDCSRCEWCGAAPLRCDCRARDDGYEDDPSDWGYGGWWE